MPQCVATKSSTVATPSTRPSSLQSEQLRDDLKDVLLGAGALWGGPREKAASASAG